MSLKWILMLSGPYIGIFNGTCHYRSLLLIVTYVYQLGLCFIKVVSNQGKVFIFPHCVAEAEAGHVSDLLSSQVDGINT